MGLFTINKALWYYKKDLYTIKFIPSLSTVIADAIFDWLYDNSISIDGVYNNPHNQHIVDQIIVHFDTKSFIRFQKTFGEEPSICLKIISYNIEMLVEDEILFLSEFSSIEPTPKEYLGYQFGGWHFDEDEVSSWAINNIRDDFICRPSRILDPNDINSFGFDQTDVPVDCEYAFFFKNRLDAVRFSTEYAKWPK